MADEPNGNRELGSLRTSIEYLRQDIAELKGSVYPLSSLVAKYESRLDQHQRELSALWKWKDGMLMRAAALVSITATLVGLVVYVVRGIG